MIICMNMIDYMYPFREESATLYIGSLYGSMVEVSIDSFCKARLK